MLGALTFGVYHRMVTSDMMKKHNEDLKNDLGILKTKIKSLNRSRKAREEEVFFTASGGTTLLLCDLCDCSSFLQSQILAIIRRIQVARD